MFVLILLGRKLISLVRLYLPYDLISGKCFFYLSHGLQIMYYFTLFDEDTKKKKTNPKSSCHYFGKTLKHNVFYIICIGRCVFT